MHYSSHLVNFKSLRGSNWKVAVLGCEQLQRGAGSFCSPEKISMMLFGKVHAGSKLGEERWRRILTLVSFPADDWLPRSSESLACAASEERVRFTSTYVHRKQASDLDNVSCSTLNKQGEHQRDDSPVKAKVHLHALLIIGLEKHDCAAACDHRPNVGRLRRVQIVGSVYWFLSFRVSFQHLRSEILKCGWRRWKEQTRDQNEAPKSSSWFRNLEAESAKGRLLDALCQTAETSHYSVPKPTMALTAADSCQISRSRCTSANTLCATMNQKNRMIGPLTALGCSGQWTHHVIKYRRHLKVECASYKTNTWPQICHMYVKYSCCIRTKKD